MNSATTIGASMIGAVLASFAVVMLTMPAQDDSHLEVENADRILALENRLADLEEQVGTINDTIETQLATKSELTAKLENTASQMDLKRLSKEWQEFKSGLAKGSNPPADLAARNGSLSESSVAILIEDRLKQLDAQKAAKAKAQEKKKVRRRAQIESASRVAKMNQLLGLSQDQNRRLADAFTKQILDRNPHWGVLKDSNAPAGERTASIDAIRASSQVLNQAASGILSSSQYTLFEEQQQRSEDKINSWLESIETQMRQGVGGK